MSFVFGTVGMSAGNEVYGIEHDGLGLAMMESFNEIEDIFARTPVALSAVNEMWAVDETQSSEQKEAVLEGVIGDVWEKLKTWVKKIWAKIKEWFNKVVEYFKTFFGSAEEFISKYEEKLHSVDTSKFVYSGHKWKDIAKVVTVKLPDPSNLNNILNMVKGKDAATLDAVIKDARDYKKDIDKITGFKSVGDMKTKLRKDAGADKKVDIRGMSVASVGDMIAVVTGKADVVSAIDDQKSELDDLLDGIEGAIDKFKSEAEKESDAAIKSKLVTFANLVVSYGKYGVSYASAALELKKDLFNAQASEYLSVLRQLARYNVRNAKEGYVPVSEGAGKGLLDAFSAGF